MNLNYDEIFKDIDYETYYEILNIEYKERRKNRKFKEKDKLIVLYAAAIEKGDLNVINRLNNIFHIDRKNIALELYEKNLLNFKRIKFISVNKNLYDIPTNLIKILIANDSDKNNKLLRIIFNSLRFYDNNLIIDLCTYYKYKIALSDFDLSEKLSNKRYRFCDYNTKNYLIYPCQTGNIELVKYLVKCGVDVNMKYIKYIKYNTKFIETPLFAACKEKKIEIVKYLIKHGADVNGEAFYGTPLIVSCEKENIELVKCLIEHGADVNKEVLDKTPLTVACEKENVELIKYLIEHGADVNKSGFYETPLTVACEKENLELIKYLIEHGADSKSQ